MIGTWPDIAYAITVLLKHSANSTEEHVSKVLYICCYLLGTPNAVLYFDNSQDQSIISLISSTPYLTIGAICSSIVMLHVGSIFLASTLCIVL